MTTTQQMQPVAERRRARSHRAPSRWRRRIRNSLRAVFTRGDLSSLVMTACLLAVTALALDAADWTSGLSALVPVSVVAVGLGFLLARSHYSELLALILSTLYGLGTVLGTNALMLNDGTTWATRLHTVATDFAIWVDQSLAGRQPDNDDTAFVLFLSILFWFLGHNAAWHVFRVDRVWRVIIPTGLVLITNQFYYQGDTSLDVYLIAFVILSLLLLIRSHIDAREFDWYMHRVSFPNYVRRTFFLAGAILAVVIVLVAWVAPAGQDDKSLDRIEELMSGDIFLELADLWSRLFSSLEGQGIATADYYGGDELQLSGAVQLGDRPVMSIEAPFGPRYYWRSTVYDTYDTNSWTWKHYRSVRAYTDQSGLRLNIGDVLNGARREVRHTVTMLIRATKLVHAAPQPVLMGLPVEAELDCIDNIEQRTCVNENRPSDVAIIQARRALRSGDSYTVTSSISTATATMLRAAEQVYPEWVLRRYLQGGSDVSPLVRDLAYRIVTEVGAQTPYDKAKAIERWLRTNIQYNESIPAPPRDADPVEWFLFQRREGYCNYYSTAMVLMLRSQNVPSRVAAGFAQGTWLPDQNTFLVRERDAHTWVEVFFPGYGWVEFEPTADEAPLDRQDDQAPQAILPTLTPPPTPTITPTPMPSMTPTPSDPGNTTPTDPAGGQFIPPTATPTPTPTTAPTSTPLPPDITRIGGEEGPSLLRIILTAFGIVLLVLALLVLLVLFLIWYVEYRGLGGLNVIQRAYARMIIYGRWLGLRFEQSSTPDERRRYLIDEVPEGEKPINTITRAYIENRYAAPDRWQTDPAYQERAKEAWRDARWAFVRRKLARLLGRDPNGD